MLNFTRKTDIAQIAKWWVQYRFFKWNLMWNSLVRQWIFLESHSWSHLGETLCFLFLWAGPVCKQWKPFQSQCQCVFLWFWVFSVAFKTALFVEFTFWALRLNLYIYTSRECARHTYQSLIVHVLYRHVDAFSIKYTTMYIWLALMELVSSVSQRPSTLRSSRKKLTVSFRGSQYTHLVLHVPPKSK